MISPNKQNAALWELIRACRLLIEQYQSSGDMIMGGNLTNEPFLAIQDALQQFDST